MLWHSLGILLVSLGVVQVVLAAGSDHDSRLVAASTQLAGGVLFLAGAVAEHRRVLRAGGSSRS